MSGRKKLIEVALPLEDINREASREKSIRHGHPSTLHLWWARRPLAACRAVLFASLVDDPSSPHLADKFPTEKDQKDERERLFEIIRELVKWENVNNENILELARAEILKSTDGNPPPVLDPFCGGGSIPLEAQRLGLEAHGSDLNPVAVLITKAMIEIPSRFAEQAPVNPDAQSALNLSGMWKGASGLAEDVRYYGEWIRKKAEKRIGHLYPKVQLPKEHGGGDATALTWIWARTVKCPNPACGGEMPLVRSFWLSKKTGKKSWIEPKVNNVDNTVQFKVQKGNGVPPEGTVNRQGIRCIICAATVPFNYARAEGKAGRMSQQLIAIVAESNRKRVYVSPSTEHDLAVTCVEAHGVPETDLPDNALGFRVQLYGMTQHRNLFTARQLIALTTFSDLVNEAREQVKADATDIGCEETESYANAVATYLAFAATKLADRNSTLTSWNISARNPRGTFARQALPMVWDYCETNPLENMGGFSGVIGWIVKALRFLPTKLTGNAQQLDASELSMDLDQVLVSTDPPYFDNIGYADLSDYFYIWLRRSLRNLYPELFNRILVPKTEELVAAPHRFEGDKTKAEEHFLTGLSKAFRIIRKSAHHEYPMTVYYAFKQSEKDNEDGGISSTGWIAMLEGLLKAGFQITGTLPMRTEKIGRAVAIGTNALASSIVLVCRLRFDNAGPEKRKGFISTLRRELPDALRHLQQGNIAPVDLAQAAIGPGMAVFSRYSSVLEADGKTMSVRTALQIINEELDAYFTEQEGDLDTDTRFCVSWFEQYGMEEAGYGEADVLARARDTSVEGIAESGILHARAGRVRLLNRDEYLDAWDPASDSDLNTWKCTQYLIRALEQGGETETARLVFQLGSEQSENARELAYRLYAICDRNGWAQEAIPYNTLVTSWANIQAERKDTAELAEQQKLLPEES